MKHLWRGAAGALVLVSLLGTSPVRAQFIVNDPVNLVQNTLTAVRTLRMIRNQVRSLRNEAQMLENDAKNLNALGYNAVGELRAALARTNELIAQAQGLAFDVDRMQHEFTRLYPQAYDGNVSAEQMQLDAQERWQQVLESLRTTTTMQAQAAQNFAVDEGTLGELVQRSQEAIGNLEATQATNQLLALQSRQAIQDQQLRVTQDRAAALEQARVVGAQERSREVRRRFVGDGGVYTPAAVHFYP